MWFLSILFILIHLAQISASGVCTWMFPNYLFVVRGRVMIRGALPNLRGCKAEFFGSSMTVCTQVKCKNLHQKRGGIA